MITKLVPLYSGSIGLSKENYIIEGYKQLSTVTNLSFFAKIDSMFDNIYINVYRIEKAKSSYDLKDIKLWII